MCGFINVRYKNVLNSRAHKNADGGDRSGGDDADTKHLLNISHVPGSVLRALHAFDVPNNTRGKEYPKKKKHMTKMRLRDVK